MELNSFEMFAFFLCSCLFGTLFSIWIQKNQLADVEEAHRRHVVTLKNGHQARIRRLEGLLHTAGLKFDRLHNDYDWMSGAYQDQIRSAQEQQDRIRYLEGKLQELGQLTPVMRAPFSAPASQINFSDPPRRRISSTNSPTVGSPLVQVVEVDEE